MTGANAYDRCVNEALGFGWPDRLIGMLFVGTPQAAPHQSGRPAPADHVREWCGPETDTDLRHDHSVPES